MRREARTATILAACSLGMYYNPNMNKWVVLFCFIIILTTNSFAASKESFVAKKSIKKIVISKKTTQEAVVNIDKLVGKLTIYLSLTDKQAKQIKPIIKEDTEKRKVIFERYKKDNDAFMNAMDNLKMRTNYKLSKYLYERQMNKLDQMQRDQVKEEELLRLPAGGKPSPRF
jgi:hypothetical protein